MVADDATPKPQRILKQQGVTTSEQYLNRLAERSFLSLWSYPGVYKDQGKGKEVCDLLVVFGNSLVIFSDKHCQYPNTETPRLDWQRWYRRAVEKSAQQVWGAERWIRSHPNRLFLDRECQRPFPIDIPSDEDIEVHRVVVAHGTFQRCRDQFGGSGSLLLKPDVRRNAHYDDACQPFVIGDIDPARGYVHVLDDTALDIVMRHLDTIDDFAAYLRCKESFFRSGRLGMAAGEEDVLALYLARVDENHQHDFIIPGQHDGVFIDEGHWADFLQSEEHISQLKADGISYFWDELIQRFCFHISQATSLATPDLSIGDQERAVRMMASENRTQRRLLAQALLGIVEITPADMKGTRVVGPTRDNAAWYLFLVLPQLPQMSVGKYRECRLELLKAYSMVLKLKCPQANDIVAIGTESKDATVRSEDVVYLDAREWTEENQAEAKQLQDDLGLLTKTGPIQSRTVLEYPSNQ